MTEYRNISGTPEDLESGRVIGVGEIFTLDDEGLKSKYNKGKISEGRFLEVKPVENPTEPPTRDELMAEAKELNITGRGNMRNDELQTAINQAKEQKGADA